MIYCSSKKGRMYSNAGMNVGINRKNNVLYHIPKHLIKTSYALDINAILLLSDFSSKEGL